MKPYAILRRPDRLSRIWLERHDGAARIRELPGAGDPGLEAAFARLASFDPTRAEHRNALAQVWTESLPAPDGWPRPPIPRSVEVPARPRATAAHPRAFRGTTFKPPKPPHARIALAPYLDRWAAVVAIGAASGPDPYLRAHHGPCREGASLDALGPAFRAFVLPLLRGLPWRAVLRISRAHEAIQAPPACTAALAHSAGASTGLWLEGARTLPPPLRLAWLTALSERSSLDGIDPAQVTLELSRLAALGDRFDQHARTFLALIAAGACPAYAASGIELSARSARPWRFAVKPAGRGDVMDRTRAVVAALDVRDNEEPHYLERAWVLSASAPEALETIASRAFAPSAARSWFSLWSCIAWEHTEEQARSLLVSIMRKEAPDDPHLPEHLAFALIDDSPIEPAKVTRALATARRLGRRPPHVQPVAALLAPVSLSDRALDACVAMTRSEGSRASIHAGLEALVLELPELVARLANGHTRALLRTSRSLGVMHTERARELLRRVLRDPSSPLPETLEQWRALAVGERFQRDPFSRALRAHLMGDRALTAAQLERHLRVAGERWDLVRLERIERAVTEELRRPVAGWGAPTLDSEALTHALALLSSAEWHRRGLKRVLRAYLAGEHDAIERHPASRAWLARHPALDPARWRDGIVLERRRDERVLRLAMERDPLEVLRLGTYVGSCLAVGASFASDAAGVVLDVNKRVIYARDRDGRAVARQLVAVSEAGELVCYSPYPIGLDPAIAALFREYDEALAAELELPLCTHDDYHVARVLSTMMWDDGLWEELRGDGQAARSGA